MAKVRYKEISKDLQSMAKPNRTSPGRSSLGKESHVSEYHYLPVDKLVPFSNQARVSFNEEELNHLADTIRQYGVRQPLTVSISQKHPDKFEIVSGERRYRSSIIAGLDKVPCIILENDNDLNEIALIENLQRKDLHPVELSESLSSMLSDSKYGDANALAKKLGMSKSKMSEILKLNTLPESVKNHLLSKQIKSRTVLRTLLKCSNEDDMLKLLGLGGVDSSTVKARSRNVLHVTTKLGSLNVICDYKRLNESQRLELKSRLEELIENL